MIGTVTGGGGGTKPIYDALVELGATPEGMAPDDIIKAINQLNTNRYQDGIQYVKDNLSVTIHQQLSHGTDGESPMNPQVKTVKFGRAYSTKSSYRTGGTPETVSVTGTILNWTIGDEVISGGDLA